MMRTPRRRRVILVAIVGLCPVAVCMGPASLLGSALPAGQPQPATTAPTTEPVATLEGLRAQAQQDFEAFINDLPVAPPLTIESLLDIRLEDRLLGLVSALPDTDGEVRLQVKDEPNLLGKVRVSRNLEHGAGTPSAPRIYMLTLARFDLPGVIMSRVEVTSIPQQGHFDVVYVLQTMEETISVHALQRPSDDPDSLPMRMDINIYDRATDEMELNLKLQAEDFTDLRRRYPAETARFLRPALEQVRQDSKLFAVDTRLAWQVLVPNADSSPELAARIKAVLGRLESPKFADREAAQKELRSLGQSAALALRNWDRASLSPQQNAEVDAFLAEYMELTSPDAEKQRSNPDFLLDCLLLEEPALRAAAWEQLKRVEPTLTGFDPAAVPEARKRWVTGTRAQLFKPTTRPVTARPPLMGPR